MTKVWNHAYYIICLLVAIVSALPPDVATFVPEKYRPYLAAAAGAAAWLKSHRNLFVNPDGTPAKVPFIEGK